MVTIAPVAWDPPPATPLGPFDVDRVLENVERWPTPSSGPEDLAIDHGGNVYTGLEDGRIVRFSRDGGGWEAVADTGGRPLGVEFHSVDRLVICDAYRGVLTLEPRGGLTVLADAFQQETFALTNNAAVGSDGTVYFSVSSRRYDLAHSIFDLLEHSGTGRLFAHGPDGSLRLLVDHLQFANGVALSRNESFVAVAESGAYRIRRLWLRGERAGQMDTLIDALPGFPDNLTNVNGVFWVAFPSLRKRSFDVMAPRPWMRRLLARLPQRLLAAPARHGLVLAIDESGAVVDNLEDPNGAYSPITTACPRGGYLYLGSISEPAVGRVPFECRA